MVPVDIYESGSSGNCARVYGSVIVDIGVPFSHLPVIDMLSATAVVVTHCHSDHLNPATLANLVRRRPDIASSVYMCASTLDALASTSPDVARSVPDRNVLSPGGSWVLCTPSGPVEMTCFEAPHDVENVGLVMRGAAGSLVWATDVSDMGGCPDGLFDTLCVEGNYEDRALREALSSTDRARAARARRNLRHLGRHRFEEFCRSHLAVGGTCYQLHVSSEFGAWSRIAANAPKKEYV